MANGGFGGNPSVEDSSEIVAVVENNGFYPVLKLSEFFDEYRISNEYREAMHVRCIRSAKIYINSELNAQTQQWKASGFETLAEVTDDPAGDGDTLVELYKQGVFLRAKADLLAEYPSMNRKDQQVNEGKESPTLQDQLREQSRLNINNLKGYNGTSRFTLI